MNDWILDNEIPTRLVAFGAVFAVVALWEVLAACRELAASRPRRWVGNLGIVLLDGLFVRLLFPTAAVGAALTAEKSGWGVLHTLQLPHGVGVLLSVVLLDLAIYLQHRVFHFAPVLWRLHKVHHADVDFDLTTGLRFHPLEIVLSMMIKMTVIGALGAPAAGVLIFEVLLSTTAIFNHGNVRVPPRLEPILRWFLVTPDMHRIHHSVRSTERDGNFGFNLPWWDRLLGTYRDQPAHGHEGMRIGLESFREASWQTLPRLLAMPFVREKPAHPIPAGPPPSKAPSPVGSSRGPLRATLERRRSRPPRDERKTESPAARSLGTVRRRLAVT